MDFIAQIFTEMDFIAQILSRPCTASIIKIKSSQYVGQFFHLFNLISPFICVYNTFIELNHLARKILKASGRLPGLPLSRTQRVFPSCKSSFISLI